jgi:hypothetical protein
VPQFSSFVIGAGNDKRKSETKARNQGICLVWVETEGYEMKLEFLLDYERSEEARFSQIKERIMRGDEVSGWDLDRFRKISTPIAEKAHHASLWPQVPLFGSLIVPIFPVSKAKFFETHGFHTYEIPKLIDFSRDTGRIQFSLGASPTLFAGFEYLDDILTEFRPPLQLGYPIEAIADEANLRKWGAEFDAATGAEFWPATVDTFGRDGFPSGFAPMRYGTLRTIYAWLRLLDYDEVAERIFEEMTRDVDKAHKILYFYGDYIVGPLTSPFQTVKCISKSDVDMFKAAGGNLVRIGSNIQLPSEIGTFIMRNLTLAPEGLEACMSIIERYESADLYSLFESLKTGVEDSKLDLVKSKSVELDKVLTDLWNDAGKIGSKIKGVSYGLSLGLSAAGYAAGQLMAGSSGGDLGILAGLGFRLFDESIDTTSSRVSARLTKMLSKSYLSSIFDFRQRYGLSRPHLPYPSPESGKLLHS